MLTGMEVRNAGAWANWSTLLPDKRTMPETFSDAGYATSLVGKMHFGGNRQFCGFDDRPYGDLTGETGHQPDPIRPLEDNRGLALRSRTSDAGVTEIPESQLQERNVIGESLSWIRDHETQRSDQPWFLCASFSRPHFPLTVPERFLNRYWPDGVTEPKISSNTDTTNHPVTRAVADGFEVDEIDHHEARKARAAYFAGIDFMDEIVGDFLALLRRSGFLENTILVYASDHGELAGEHGLWWKHTWHEAATRVPLMIQTPDYRRTGSEAKRFDTPVGLIDIFPTLCDLCDVSSPDAIDGRSLATAIRTDEEPSRGPVVCDNLTKRWGDGTEFRMVRDGRYKYVGFKGDYQDLLFNIVDDPLETENLATDPDDAHETALQRLREFVGTSLDFEAADEQKEKDEAWARAEFELQTPETTDGNLYHLPDGRLVDAGKSIYDPSVVVENPVKSYDDWPYTDK